MLQTSGAARLILIASIAFVSAAPAGAQACDEYGLRPETMLSFGEGMRGVAIADFNGDGHADIATSSLTTHDVIVAFGTGAGTFGAGSRYAAAWRPHGLVAADFDGDLHVDLAVTDTDEDAVWILTNNGNGTFGEAVAFDTGDEPRGLTVADFNDDDALDLAVANTASNSVSVLLGDGDGAFTAASPLTAQGAWSVVAGDFDSDGHLDLAVSGSSSGIVTIHPGTGTGAFDTPSPIAIPDSPRSMAVGDFNADTHPDLVVTRMTATDVSVLLGVGDGTFATAVTYLTGTGSASAVVTDVNLDGDQDLVVGNAGASVALLIGNGTGTFAPARSYSAGGTNEDIGAADFNSDGRIDVVVPAGNALDVLRNVCYPAVTSISPSSGPGAGGTVVTITGTGFDTRSGLTVKFGGKDTYPNCPSATTCTVTAPSGSGTVSVRVLVGPSGREPGSGWLSKDTPADDYTYLPSLTITGYSVNEGTGGTRELTFWVALSAAMSEPVTVNYATVNGTATAPSDFTATSGTLTFAPGETGKAVLVALVTDATAERDETFSVALSNANNALLGNASATGTIQNDDGEMAAGLYLLAPCRLLDTRSPSGTPTLQSLQNVAVRGYCGVPANARALVYNVTVLANNGDGWVVVYPGPSGNIRPTVSTINYRRQKTRANNGIVPITTDGTINVFNSGPSWIDVLIDVTGYFD